MKKTARCISKGCAPRGSNRISAGRGFVNARRDGFVARASRTDVGSGSIESRFRPPLSLPRPRCSKSAIPHPALVKLFADTAGREGVLLQRSAHIGALTDSAYVQFVGAGVAAIDLGFPCRYTHSSLEVCDLADLVGLTRLLVAALPRIDGKFSLDRDDFIQ